MPDTTPNLALPFILPAQAQKHVTHNEALQRLDAERQPPGEHVAAEPIHHRDQVQVAAAQRHVGDVAAPHLVGPVDRQERDVTAPTFVEHDRRQPLEAPPLSRWLAAANLHLHR